MRHLLNSSQQEAVEHTDGPLLVLAGAGSGKTRIVTQRIMRLLEKGVPAHQIVAVTFTNKAAAEMRERVSQLTSSPLLICTFHSLGVRILRQSIDHLGYSTNFTIYDEEDAIKLIRSCMQEVGLKDRRLPPKRFKHLISQAKNQLTQPDDVDISELTNDGEQFLPQVYRLYQKKLAECEALDFDDLLFMVVRLFQECPEVLEYYQTLWRYLLIDEYQDTNAAQYQIAQLLVEKSRNIFVVGDPDQSIYSWRGANIQNILNFEKDYPGAQTVALEQNYRSRSNILEAANEVIRLNGSRYEKNLWSDRGEGEKIFVFRGDGDRDEASYVVNQIEGHQRNNVSLTEMVIFYRTNAQSRVFEDALLRERIPYVIVGGISFYHRREIKDILAFLRVVNSPADVIAFMRTINLPKRGIGDTSLGRIVEAANREEMPIFYYCQGIVEGHISPEGYRLSAKQKAGLKDYINIILELKKAQEVKSVSDLVMDAIHLTGYLNFIRMDKETFEDRKANLDELITKALEWEEEDFSENPLEKFLEELSLTTTLDEASTDEVRLSLMTVHNSKGLEFDIVFLVGMEEDLFPHANSRHNEAALEEERRLFYVGMTRAKERLYLSSAKYRYIWKELRPMYQSRFLREIPRRYLQNVTSFHYV